MSAPGTSTPRYQLRIVPWLRPVGRLLLREWLAITLGRTILAWRPLNPSELAHELEHVRQWQRHGLLFPLVYLAASVAARRSGGRWYRDNRFEVAAREAAQRA